MAFETKTGQFTLNLAPGNQAVTGIGFLPKLVILMSNSEDVNEINAHWHFAFGAMDDSGSQFCVEGTSEDNQAASDCSWGNFVNRAINQLLVGTSVDDYIGVYVSMDADGFTINVTNAPATAVEIAYIALGGSDLTNVDIDSFQKNAGAGNQAVAGVGFRPDAVIFAGVVRAFEDAKLGGDTYICLGFMDADGNQGTLGVWSEDGEAVSDTARAQLTNKCYLQLWNGSIVDEAQFVSMDAGGFTINWTLNDGGTEYINYIALKGGEYHVGNFLSQVGIGNFAESGVGFTSVGGIFSSVCNPAYATAQDHNEISVGFAADSTETIAMGGTDEDNQADTDADRWMYEDSIYRNYDFAQNLDGEIELVSWETDGFWMDQVDADPAQNEIIYLVFGPTPLVPTVSPYPTAWALCPSPKRGFQTLLYQNVTPGTGAVPMALGGPAVPHDITDHWSDCTIATRINGATRA